MFKRSWVRIPVLDGHVFTLKTTGNKQKGGRDGPLVFFDDLDES